MAESFVSKAARIIRVGNELSGTNQKMKNAIHAFLIWFCPIVVGESLPIENWKVSNYDNGPWILYFHYESASYRVRSDGFECGIKDYLAFCAVLADSEELLFEWMNKLIQQRRESVQRIEQIPAVVDYKPARSTDRIEVGRTDCPLAVFRSHPDFPNALAPELEGAWSSLNPAWPEETVERILKRLDPPCHTVWKDFATDRTEKRDDLTATVIYVRPGPQTVPTSPLESKLVSG